MSNLINGVLIGSALTTGLGLAKDSDPLGQGHSGQQQQVRLLPGIRAAARHRAPAEAAGPGTA